MIRDEQRRANSSVAHFLNPRAIAWIRKDEHQQHPDDDDDADHLRVSVDQMRKPAVVEKHVNYAIPSRA